MTAPADRDRPAIRPATVVVVVGTGTDIGKTWVAARLLDAARAEGMSVTARKPAQSFDPGDVERETTDAQVLGHASGEPAEVVCAPHRWYEVAMAPPMAAEVLGRPAPTTAELAAELRWPDERVDLGLVETAGGVRSPLSADGDALDLVNFVQPDCILVVADAGLGTINAVLLTVEALESARRADPRARRPRVIVHLNRFTGSDLHQRNLAWLRSHLAGAVTCSIDDAAGAIAGR